MKKLRAKLITILLTAIIISCAVQADTDDYNLFWDISSEPDLAQLHIYKWEGIDTLLCEFFPLMPLDISHTLYFASVNPYSGADLFQATADGDSTYISVMIQYQDNGGLYGGTGWATVVGSNSHFLISKNINPPGTPEGGKISH